MNANTPLQIRVLPFCSHLSFTRQVLFQDGNHKDGSGRPVGKGGLRLSERAGGKVIYLPRRQFDVWFEAEDDYFRPRAHAYAFDIRAQAAINFVPPTKASVIVDPTALQPGAMPGVAAMFHPLVAAYYLHNIHSLGPQIIPREHSAVYRFLAGEVELDPPTSDRGSPELSWFVGRRRGSYRFGPADGAHTRSTVFGDPAVPGDIEIFGVGTDPGGVIVPNWIFKRWMINDGTGKAIRRFESSFLRVGCAFELSLPGSTEFGNAGDYIVVEYDPRAVSTPTVVTRAEVEAHFEIASAG